MLVTIIHSSQSFTQPAIQGIHTRLGGVSPWSYPLEFRLGYLGQPPAGLGTHAPRALMQGVEILSTEVPLGWVYGAQTQQAQKFALFRDLSSSIIFFSHTLTGGWGGAENCYLGNFQSCMDMNGPMILKSLERNCMSRRVLHGPVWSFLGMYTLVLPF